jgi:hypothetical protein
MRAPNSALVRQPIPQFSDCGDKHDQAAHHPLIRTVEQADLGARSRQCEKRWQQQDPHDVFQLLGENMGDFAVVRNDRSEQKRSKYRMNPDAVRCQRRDQNAEQNARHRR